MATTSNIKREEDTPGAVVRVGVGVLVLTPDKPGAVLVGTRRGSHGSGTISLPGGHLEMGETWAQCALREIEEETNLQLDPLSLRFVCATNDIFDARSKHYVTLFLQGQVSPTSPPLVNREPHKCEGWEWAKWGDLQQGKYDPLFLPLHHAIQDGLDPFEQASRDKARELTESP